MKYDLKLFSFGPDFHPQLGEFRGVQLVVLVDYKCRGVVWWWIAYVDISTYFTYILPVALIFTPIITFYTGQVFSTFSLMGFIIDTLIAYRQIFCIYTSDVVARPSKLQRLW